MLNSQALVTVQILLKPTANKDVVQGSIRYTALYITVLSLLPDLRTTGNSKREKRKIRFSTFANTAHKLQTREHPYT